METTYFGVHSQSSVVMLGAVRRRVRRVITHSSHGCAFLCCLLLLGLCFAGLARATLFGRRSCTIGLPFSCYRLRYVLRRLCGFNSSYRCPIWRRWECARSNRSSIVREEARGRQGIIWHHRRRVTRAVGTAFRRLSVMSSRYEPRRGRIEIGIKSFWMRWIVRHRLNRRRRLTARSGLRSSVGGLPFRVIV